MKQETVRNGTLDTLKGIAIILVIFAHCIQFGSGSNYLESKSFYDNVVFKFIYSFHMPLFMLISGYLFHFSIQNHSFLHNLKTRFNSLLLPIIVWQTIWILLGGLNNYDGGVLYIFNSYLNTLWFISSVFINCIIVLLCNKFAKDSFIIYGMIFSLSLFIPNYHGYNLFVFMFPYFIGAYFYNKAGGIKKNFNNRIKVAGVACILVLFALLLLHYDINDYAYTSGTFIVRNRVFSATQMYTDVFRWGIGLIGSLCVIIFFDIICTKCPQLLIIRGLRIIGTKTMGLYIVSTYLFKLFHLLPINEFNYLYIIIESIMTISLSYLLICFIEKNKYTRAYLLGGR